METTTLTYSVEWLARLHDDKSEGEASVFEGGDPAHSVAWAPWNRVLASHCASVLMYEVEFPLRTCVAVTVEALTPSGASPVIHAILVSGVGVASFSRTSC